MITISKSTEKELKKFNDVEYQDIIKEHYGDVIDSKDKSFYLKAVKDGEIIGSASGKFESGLVYLFDLMVGKASRRTGVGRMLMQKVEEIGKELGAHKVQLYTGQEWKASKFYEALGYEVIAELPDHHFHRYFVIYQKYI